MYLPRTLISHLYTSLLKNQHPLSAPVLILSALEPDAICACRILTSLLKRDFIPHKIQPVSGYSDLERIGRQLVQPLKQNQGGTGGVVICLGVGGLIDLASLLGLEDETSSNNDLSGVEVWVLDSRRPWNLSNVFGGQPANLNAGDTRPQRTPGVDRGCLQKSYRPGKGGIIVFDDGDIDEELAAERNAYCELADMPEVEEVPEEESDGEDDDGADDVPPSNTEEDDFSSHGSSQSRKRKSWSDRAGSDSESERPPQRRRSNSGSSISSHPLRPRSTSPPSSSQPPSAKELRRKLQNMRIGHEKVLKQYYSLGTSYSEPISSLAYSLASELGREDNDLLWLAIVGVTSLELSGHTSTGLGTPHVEVQKRDFHQRPHQSWYHTRSQRIYGLLRDEVRRHNPQSLASSNSRTTLLGLKSMNASSPSDTSITLVPDPRLPLLRHWSLYDSLLHSAHLASRLHVWNDAGIKRLHKLLAKMGISLQQCRQGYMHMDVNVRADLRARLDKYSGLYGLEGLVPQSGDAAYEQEGWGFTRSWGWKAQLSAVDVGLIVSAILEAGPTTARTTSQQGSGATQDTNVEEVVDRSEALIPRFFAAYDALSSTNPNKLIAAVPITQSMLKSIHRTGSLLLSKHQIRHLRAFRMGVVKDGPDLALFANSPGALVKLALWVAEAVAVSERDRKGSDSATPLVLAALDEPRGTYVVVGTGGGIGSGEDFEHKKEQAEKREQKKQEREAKRKVRDDAKAARRAQRELNGDSDGEEEDEEEEESDISEDEDENNAEADRRQKRGYGRNRFGIAFQEVVEETNARVKIDSFEHCVVEVKKEDLAGFLEGLSLKSVVGR